MAEINNSLALGVKADAPDLGKTLLNVGQINYLRANTAKTQQDIDYNQTLQDQGQNGMRPQEENTLAEAHTKQLGVQGQIGNMMVNAKTPEDRLQAIKASEDAGKPVDPKTKQHLLDIPLSQFRQYGANMQRAGQTSTANIEQDPSKIGQRSYQGAAGSTAGPIGGEMPPTPNIPAMMPRAPGAPIRTNPDGSINGNIATAPAPVNPLAAKGATEAKNAELIGNANKNVEEFAGYKTAAANSSTTKTVLHSLQDDADRVYTGKGATGKADAQKWILSASNLPGVGPLIKHFAGDQTDPVAAMENIKKNIGIISRTAVGDIGERSAAALENVQNSLPTEEMSSKGLKLATSQMMAIEDFKQARLQEANKWQQTHGGSLNGFAADWSKNMGPATFVMARLPKEEQIAIRQRLGKTPEGKRTLDSLDAQLKWGHEHGLDSVID